MYGIAAIEQANGWAMAGAGACIVLTGLSILSFLISMIPRLTTIFEKKKPLPDDGNESVSKPVQQVKKEDFPEDVKKASALFMENTTDLGDVFTLIDLHKKSKELGVVDPHFTIRRFREAGILICTGDECFSWQPPSE